MKCLDSIAVDAYDWHVELFIISGLIILKEMIKIIVLHKYLTITDETRSVLI